MALAPIYIEAGTTLRNLRLDQGRSQADVANAANISINKLKNIENYTRAESMGDMADVARALNGVAHFIVNMPAPPPITDDVPPPIIISGGMIK